MPISVRLRPAAVSISCCICVTAFVFRFFSGFAKEAENKKGPIAFFENLCLLLGYADEALCINTDNRNTCYRLLLLVNITQTALVKRWELAVTSCIYLI